MKILLFGKNGQVGWELQRSLAPLGEIIAPKKEIGPLCGDLTNLAGLAHTIQSVTPDVIVNAAAYTAVDDAESKRELAQLINTEAPEILGQEAKKCGAYLIHYSTDYVFDGSGSKAWTESDKPAPLNFYGKTKLAGELAIQESGCNHFIFRTSWAYAARGKNFVKTILRLAKERDALSMIDDQIGAPTGAELIADITAHAISQSRYRDDISGLYHLVAGGETSWYNFARFVLDQAQSNGVALKTTADIIVPISSDNYPTAAKRPLNSRLNTMKLQQVFGLSLPDWQSGVRRMLDEIL